MFDAQFTFDRFGSTACPLIDNDAGFAQSHHDETHDAPAADESTHDYC